MSLVELPLAIIPNTSRWRGVSAANSGRVLHSSIDLPPRALKSPAIDSAHRLPQFLERVPIRHWPRTSVQSRLRPIEAHVQRILLSHAQ